jgi:hypothetical protein
VIDGAAHRAHGQRLANARFDQTKHIGIGRGNPGDLDPDIDDGFSEIRILPGHRRRYQRCEDGPRQHGEHAHQKACLFLTSSA